MSDATDARRLTILSLVPPRHVATVFRPETWQDLRSHSELIENEHDRHLSPDEVAENLVTCEAIVTGWGFTPFTADHLDAAERLELVIHTAGSVKRLFSAELVTDRLIPRGIRVISGYDEIAINVAEATIGLMIAASRRWPEQAAAYRSERRKELEVPKNGRFLTGATVGLVSASKVARRVLPLLAAFQCRVLIYDPYLSDGAAAALGAERVGLNELFERSDIVSVHAPSLPATRNLIGREQLSRLRDGASFVNTARGAIVNHEALLAEARSGRIQIALDVTEPEPLDPDSALWDLPNVMLLPHTAGMGHAGLLSIGELAAAALRKLAARSPLPDTVPLERWETLA